MFVFRYCSRGIFIPRHLYFGSRLHVFRLKSHHRTRVGSENIKGIFKKVIYITILVCQTYKPLIQGL